MKMVQFVSDPGFLVGQFLLSMPGIGDPRFERAVIAMCVHDDQGAFGLMVNRTVDTLTVRELMQQLDIDPGQTPESAQVMLGGPVEPGRGFVLHSPDYSGQGTISVADAVGGTRWGMTSTTDVLRDIAAGNGPRHWLAALGFTGWSPGQLDSEMTRHGWHNLHGEDDLIFALPVERRWPEGFARLGINVGHLSTTAGTA